MPHAENGSVTAPAVNGEKPSSQFINHVASYPVVSDSLSAIKSHPYGAKGLALADNVTSRAISTLPQASRDYLTPYAQHVDQLADGGLSKVDSRYPVIKSDTEKLKRTLLDYAFLPLHLAGQAREYVLGKYEEEYKKLGGRDGLVKGGTAVVTTGLVVTSETLMWVAEYLGEKKEEAKGVGREKVEQAKGMGMEKVEQAKGLVKEKKGQVKEGAKEKADQVQK
ncbi:MAG: hypothetical protein Q9167_006728 [Letrouitia subvulpina]